MFELLIWVILVFGTVACILIVLDMINNVRVAQEYRELLDAVNYLKGLKNNPVDPYKDLENWDDIEKSDKL